MGVNFLFNSNNRITELRHIIDNTASIVAGGVFVQGTADVCDVTFRGCQIRDNASNGAKGGGLVTADFATTLDATLVCGNLNGNTVGAWVDGGGNCITEVCTDCATEECPADLNEDDVIDGADLTLLLAEWACTEAGCIADIDGSGFVDGADLTIILSSWGPCKG